MVYLRKPSEVAEDPEMKGSDKWGRGGGPRIRIELVLAGLLALAAAGAYLYYLQTNQLTTEGQGTGVTRITTTGISCGDSSMPLLAQQVENSSTFSALSAGLCYNFVGENSSGGPTVVLYFDRYNGTIDYPCGTDPRMLVSSEIIAVADPTIRRLASIQLLGPSSLNLPPACPSHTPLGIVSVTDVESTIPAVPQLNLTLMLNSGAEPVTSLTAKLTLDGGTQTFKFSASPTSMLLPGQSSSSTEVVLGKVSFTGDEVYPLAVSGTFENGQSFSFHARVQIAQVP